MLRELVAGVLERGAKRLAAFLRERDEYAVIPRDKESTYMVRYYWTKLVGIGESFTKHSGSFIHEFVSSDLPGEVHTHPWKWMVSIILSPSGYKEIRYEWAPSAYTIRPIRVLGNLDVSELVPDASSITEVNLLNREVRYFGPLSINVIKHHHAHRVELYGEEPCWTLFIHGPRVSGWGFIKESAPHDFREVKQRTNKLKAVS